MDSQSEDLPGLEYVVEKLADCTQLLARVEAGPDTAEHRQLRDELKEAQRQLLSAACAFGPPERTWLAQ